MSTPEPDAHGWKTPKIKRKREMPKTKDVMNIHKMAPMDVVECGLIQSARNYVTSNPTPNPISRQMCRTGIDKGQRHLKDIFRPGVSILMMQIDAATHALWGIDTIKSRLAP